MQETGRFILETIKDKFSKGQKYTYIWLNLTRSRFENLSAYYIGLSNTLG